MREILFRGKRTDNGEWVYGDLIKNLIYDGREKEIRIGDIYFEHNGDIHGTAVCKVIPETVGQFTGLCDKNGNKIFEGDIAEFTDKYLHKKGRAKIVFEASKWKYSGCYYGGNPIVWLCINDSSIEFEVIGNIHDNPELLKEI